MYLGCLCPSHKAHLHALMHASFHEAVGQEYMTFVGCSRRCVKERISSPTEVYIIDTM